MKQRRILRLLALVGVLTLIGAACSNDDDPEPGGDTAATGATGGAVDCDTGEFGCVEVASGAPITVGTLLAISGDTASLGQDSQDGATLAIDYLDGTLDGNLDGELLGHTVELSNEDDLCAAEGGQAGATALAADPSIVAVIGTSCSSAALGVADTILSDKGILLISPSNTNPGLTSEEAHQPFYLRTAHNDKIQGAIVSDFVLHEAGAHHGSHDQRREPVRRRPGRGVPRELRGGGWHHHGGRGDQQRRHRLQAAPDEHRAGQPGGAVLPGLQPGVRARSRSRPRRSCRTRC